MKFKEEVLLEDDPDEEDDDLEETDNEVEKEDEEKDVSEDFGGGDEGL